MKFVLTIELGNDAMKSAQDIAFALEQMVARLTRETDQRLTKGDHWSRILDNNGNVVGQAEVVDYASTLPQVELARVLNK